MRIMAIDYGDARTGVAISDPTGLLAGYTTVIQSRKVGVVAEELARLAKEHSVDELVMGFPRNMDGTEGPRAELYRAFAARLEEVCGLKPVLWDERRTTVEAHGILHASGKRMKQHKKTVDAVAATLILEVRRLYAETHLTSEGNQVRIPRGAQQRAERTRRMSSAGGGQPGTRSLAQLQQAPMPRPSKGTPRQPWPMAMGRPCTPLVWRARTRLA